MGKSKKEIAEELGVHQPTVYRELKRNAKKNGGYSARYTEELYQKWSILRSVPLSSIKKEDTGTGKWIL
jgi:IS30 family transposase